MTFEEMQIILAGVVVGQAEIQASQATFRENQAEIQASQATFRENQAQIQASHAETNQAIEADRQARAEAHIRHELEMAVIRQQNAETAAIANSNARAIEAATNQQAHDRELSAQRYAQSQQQLIELARIVGQFAESTTQRLTALENSQ